MADLREFHLKEALDYGHLCPVCRSYMTSGILMPDGDYDNWIVQPHCSSETCPFETTSTKNPYNACIPAEFKPKILYVYGLVKIIEVNADVHLTIMVFNYLPDFDRPDAAIRYDGFIKLCEVTNTPGDTLNSFPKRAMEEGKNILKSKGCQLIKGSDRALAPYALVNDPAFVYI